MSQYICRECGEEYDDVPEDRICTVCFEVVVDSEYGSDYLSELEEFF